ncbi:MAG: hypothetical protein AB1403_25190, partial [Candidatus Riflebacteria bacterium]
MIKIKYFGFIVGMAAIMLLALGERVTPVQANNAGIDTPIPTGTPVETPNTLPGEFPSAEEQEALKAVVQSYVEIRYHALSVSNTEDLNQNTFGRLISETAKAAAFLSEEMSKLAVEVKRADTYHLRFVDYKYFLDYQSITIDPTTQTATILVTEGNEVIYEISAELNPENPIISHTAGIEHVILLRKMQGEWKIVSDTYNDDLWKMLRHGGKSADEIHHASNEMIRILDASPKSLTIRQTNAQALPAYTLPDDPSS